MPRRLKKDPELHITGWSLLRETWWTIRRYWRWRPLVLYLICAFFVALPFFYILYSLPIMERVEGAICDMVCITSCYECYTTVAHVLLPIVVSVVLSPFVFFIPMVYLGSRGDAHFLYFNFSDFPLRRCFIMLGYELCLIAILFLSLFLLLIFVYPKVTIPLGLISVVVAFVMLYVGFRLFPLEAAVGLGIKSPLRHAWRASQAHVRSIFFLLFLSILALIFLNFCFDFGVCFWLRDYAFLCRVLTESLEFTFGFWIYISVGVFWRMKEEHQKRHKKKLLKEGEVPLPLI